MDSSPSLPHLPPPPNPNHHHNTATTTTTTTSNDPTQPPNLHTTLSTLKHLIHLSKSTLTSLSTLLPTATTTTVTATCPYNSNHRIPPTSLFHHYLRCPSSPAPIDLTLLNSLHYPNSLQSPLINQIHYSNDTNADLSISLNNYHTSPESNFFYRDCPAVVSFPPSNNDRSSSSNNADRMLTLPAVLLAECDTNNNSNSNADDMRDTISDSDSYVVELLPSEYCNVRNEIDQWKDYPSFYSYGVMRVIACCCVSRNEELTEWILVNSPFYGVVIDVFTRDHILLLFRLTMKAVYREAITYMVSVYNGETAGSSYRFECPVLVKALGWLASQLAILYGEVNGKLFAVSILKQVLLITSSKCLFVFGEKKGNESVDLSEGKDGSRMGVVLVSQVAAAVAALHERSEFETKIKAIRGSWFVPVYQRVQEHEFISKTAEVERKKRPNYRSVIEHDGVLWNRGGNKDSNKSKSREELLAEERDYKRRRMSYRGKKMKRSTTQVMRDIIDEYMEEIKHANMSDHPSEDPSKLASEPSSLSNVHVDKHIHDEFKDKSHQKESKSDNQDKSNKHRRDRKHNEYSPKNDDRHRSSSRSHDRGQRDEHKRSKKDDYSSPDRGHRSRDNRKRSKHNDTRSSSIVSNEFEDRYNPSTSQDADNYDL
ncbi:U11/U12 small nuclear ribonucleoprotein 48 kDa protein [Rutidosis leptorrhynchoides]|uniref:U11/U12 small nuclear ribonucleoprotein 48 kDa protein n=1 Tax=Rutidosis leptorrhynchoides TaxID=125765 RepID=UPI003A9A64EC